MAQPAIHKSKRHANPFKTKTGKDRLKALTLKVLYEMLDKVKEAGKKRAKIAKEIARREVKWLYIRSKVYLVWESVPLKYEYQIRTKEFMIIFINVEDKVIGGRT